MKSIFSIRLKEERLNKNLTQQKLVDLINEEDFDIKVSRNSITRYENGTRTADYSTLCAISYILNVDIDYLLGKSDKKHIELANEQISSFLKPLIEIIKKDNEKTNDALFSLISATQNIISLAYENDFLDVMQDILEDVSTITALSINNKNGSKIDNLRDSLRDIVDSEYYNNIRISLEDVVIDITKTINERGTNVLSCHDINILRLYYKNDEPNNIPDIINELINNKEGE